MIPELIEQLKALQEQLTAQSKALASAIEDLTQLRSQLGVKAENR